MKFSSVVDSISAVAGGAGINLKMDRDRGELKKIDINLFVDYARE